MDLFAHTSSFILRWLIETMSSTLLFTPPLTLNECKILIAVSMFCSILHYHNKCIIAIGNFRRWAFFHLVHHYECTGRAGTFFASLLGICHTPTSVCKTANGHGSTSNVVLRQCHYHLDLYFMQFNFSYIWENVLTALIALTVHSMEFYISVTTTLNCTSCSSFVVIFKTMAVLYQSQLNAQFDCAVVLHNLLFQSAVTLL